jgi:hypothetical protein
VFILNTKFLGLGSSETWFHPRKGEGNPMKVARFSQQYLLAAGMSTEKRTTQGGAKFVATKALDGGPDNANGTG